MKNKCRTCLARYVCDREYEWECQTHDYFHYIEDKQKVEELNKEENK